MFRILIPAFLLLGAGVLAAQKVDQRTQHSAAMTSAPAAAPDPIIARNVRIRGENGHFPVEARIDGRHMNFIVDTGASQIALRESDAAKLGFHPTERDYNVRVNTANGVGRAAWVDLHMVEVGGLVVRDLRALVHPDEALSVNLLGMTFLSRVRFAYERGTLVLEQ